MGLFDLFKNKKQPEPKKEPQQVLKELEAAEDFGTIAKILAENNLISKPKDEFHNVFGEDIRHLSYDDNLPWGWEYYYKDFVEKQQKKIDAKWNAVYACRLTTDKLEAYKKYFDTISGIGTLCQKTGECHYKWFCEAILGSVWYNDHLEKYERLKIEAPDLIKHEKLLETLETDVMSKLAECEGVLQSDFIKMFDPVIKADVSSFLYQAEKSSKIKRTKSGRSYILEVIK